jgi:N-acylneuraminate cytidylyltransferase
MSISKCIAIIPARGGSKRIPRKNIRNFCGEPIIKYSITSALQSRCFDEVMVSTDCDDIANIAMSYGAKIPFMRSKKASDDNTLLDDVLMEVIKNYHNNGVSLKKICCILPTAPFLTAEILKEGLNLFHEKKVHAVFPVIRFSYPIQRALKISDGYLKMYWAENKNKRSQDFELAYHDAGQFYWLDVENFLKTKSLFPEKSQPLIISEMKAHDIDDEEDWQLAEIKFKYSLFS